MIKVDMKVEFKDFAKIIDARTIRDSFKEVVIEEGKNVQSQYRFIQSHFSPKNRAKIKRKSGSGRSPVDGSPGSIYSAVGTDQERSVLVWLGAGTNVRYRTMSLDWKSMTSPGGGMSFGSRKGRALGFGHHPGIAARNFRDDIIDKLYPGFVKRSEKAVRDLLQGARWI